MRRRSRTRRVLKWVGLVGCGATVLVWASSMVWIASFYWCTNAQTVLHVLGTHPGSLRYTMVYNHPSAPEGFSINTVRSSMHPYRHLLARPWVMWTGRVFHPQPRTDVFMPLWLVLLALAIPTAILWYRDRRPPKGHCQNCEYDLTGNVSGTCPECGHETEQTVHRSDHKATRHGVQ